MAEVGSQAAAMAGELQLSFKSVVLKLKLASNPTLLGAGGPY